MNAAGFVRLCCGVIRDTGCIHSSLFIRDHKVVQSTDKVSSKDAGFFIIEDNIRYLNVGKKRYRLTTGNVIRIQQGELNG